MARLTTVRLQQIARRRLVAGARARHSHDELVHRLRDEQRRARAFPVRRVAK